MPATGTGKPAGPGKGVHMVVDLPGRAEALILAALGHRGRALVDRLEQLQPNGVAERGKAPGRLGEVDLVEPLTRQSHLPGDGPLCTRGSDERSEEHTSELQSRFDLVWRLLLANKK